jgi:hypothetical protein
MPVLYANNAASRLAASITSVATSFSVTAGHGAKFPAISGGDYFYATLMDSAGNLEVVKVTARATDTFTVARAQEGTTARAYSVNDIVDLRITKLMLDDFKTDTRAGNAATATTLQTGRTIALTGDVAYTSGSFNGAANVTGTATLANSGVTAGTYTKVTVDAKGRVTVGASLASADLPTYTGTITSAQVTTALGATPVYTTTDQSIAGVKTFTQSRIQVSGGGVAMLEMHVPGLHARGWYLDTAGVVRLAQTNGVGVATTVHLSIDGSNNFKVGSESGDYAYAGNSMRFMGGLVAGLMLSCPTTANSNQISFWNPNGNIGYINSSGSGTVYGTSSDYRLKEDIEPMVGAIEKIAQLRPVKYKWKVDGSAGEGFVAHELQEIFPDAVAGEKDAVDAQGNPRYQAIDTSYLVATLAAAIQEQQTLIVALTARVTQLESRSS